MESSFDEFCRNQARRLLILANTYPDLELQNQLLTIAVDWLKAPAIYQLRPLNDRPPVLEE